MTHANLEGKHFIESIPLITNTRSEISGLDQENIKAHTLALIRSQQEIDE